MSKFRVELSAWVLPGAEVAVQAVAYHSIGNRTEEILRHSLGRMDLCGGLPPTHVDQLESSCMAGDIATTGLTIRINTVRQGAQMENTVVVTCERVALLRLSLSDLSLFDTVNARFTYRTITNLSLLAIATVAGG